MSAGSISFCIPGPPTGKGRHRTTVVYRKGAHGKPQAVTGRDGRVLTRAYTNDATLSYEGKVAYAAREAMGGRAPLWQALALRVEIDVLVPMSKAKSWRERALAGREHPTTKPDCTNIVKAIEDGCQGVAMVDDKQIVSLTVHKRYAQRAEVRVFIRALADGPPARRTRVERLAEPELFEASAALAALEEDPFA